VLADLPGMLKWSPAQSVTVIECDSGGRPTRARWRENYGPLQDEFVLQYEWDGSDGVGWKLLEGRILKKEDGLYRLAVTSEGATNVTHGLELGICSWVPSFIRSRVESMIVEATLTALKTRVETFE
jgi:hypothetical protein